MAVDDLTTVGDAPSLHDAPSIEWAAASLRPVAHWVQMPGEGGRTRLEMVWQVPDPLPPS